jgi:hypothetical protein
MSSRDVRIVCPRPEASSCNYCCSGKAISIIYSDCLFFALGIQHAMRMRHIFISGPLLHCHTLPHFLVNGTFFGKKKLLSIWCVFWLSLQRMCKAFLILRSIQRDTVVNVIRCSCKVTYFSQILINLEFSPHIFEKYSNIRGARWCSG